MFGINYIEIQLSNMEKIVVPSTILIVVALLIIGYVLFKAATIEEALPVEERKEKKKGRKPHGKRRVS